MNLSNIELYYTPPTEIKGNSLVLDGDEFQHVTRVMRHSENDTLYVTDGIGHIFKSIINSITKDYLSAEITETHSSKNKLKNIYFCIPKLKSPERFEFALEKCTELGITNFIVFDSERSFKKNEKIGRWNKILLSAMKQSLHSFLPTLVMEKSFIELLKRPGIKVMLEQNSSSSLSTLNIEDDRKYFFIFGPEGGLSPRELSMVEESYQFKLTNNRLRAETAIVTSAAVINLI